MLNMIHCLFVFLALVIIMLAFGYLFTRRDSNQSLVFSFVIGFFAYYAFSHIIILPMMLTKQSLTNTTILWFCIMTCVVVLSVVLNHKGCFLLIKRLLKAIKSLPAAGYFAIAFVVVQLVIVVGFGYPDSDDVYYTGNISTALYTDTMNIYNPYTGQINYMMELRYAMATYPMSSAVICKMFAIHPLLLTRIVLPAMMIIVSNLIYYKIAQKLFPGDVTAVMLFIVMAAIVNLFGNTSIYTSSRFLYTRIAQGKSILCNIVIPALVLFSIMITEKSNSRKNWGYMLLLAITGNAFTLSSMFVLPAAMGGFCIPFSIIEKNWRIFRNFIICMIPCVITIVVYYLHTAGYIIIK